MAEEKQPSKKSTVKRHGSYLGSFIPKIEVVDTPSNPLRFRGSSRRYTIGTSLLEKSLLGSKEKHGEDSLKNPANEESLKWKTVQPLEPSLLTRPLSHQDTSTSYSPTLGIAVRAKSQKCKFSGFVSCETSQSKEIIKSSLSAPGMISSDPKVVDSKTFVSSQHFHINNWEEFSATDDPITITEQR